MKKIGILIILFALVFMLTACGTEPETTEGKYHHKKMHSADAVLDYLNNFDDEKYEIVAITQEGIMYTVFYEEIDAD